MATPVSRNTPSPGPLLPKAPVAAHPVGTPWECLDVNFERCGHFLDESRPSSQSVRDRGRHGPCRWPTMFVGPSHRGLAAVKPEARRCPPAWSRALSNRSDQRIDIEPDGCERVGNLTRDIANELRLPQRGEVWWLAFDPSVVGDARKNGATVIVSNDVASRELTSTEIASP